MSTSAQLRAASQTLAERAGWLETALDPVARLAGADVWRGPVADRFDEELAAQRRRLTALSDDLTTAARLLMVDANQLDLDRSIDVTRLGRPS